MCNCGKKTINKPAYQANQGYQQQEIKPLQQGIRFQYTGSTALTAVGNITGRRYRFSRPYDIQLIDQRDAVGLRQVHVLKQF
jgi:hypothetical protein